MKPSKHYSTIGITKLRSFYLSFPTNKLVDSSKLTESTSFRVGHGVLGIQDLMGI